MTRLNSAGIGATVNYRAVPTTRYYKEKYPEAAPSCPVACAWGEQTLSLPLFPSLTREEQSYVIEIVQRELYPLAQR